MIETHGNFQAPANCTEGRAEVMPMGIISAVLVNDSEVASALLSLHLPVREGVFIIEQDNLGPLQQMVWTWNHSSEEPSEISLGRVDSNVAEYQRDDRYFWATPFGISYMDLHQRLVVPNVELYPTFGTLSPPMLQADDGPTPYAAMASYIIESEFSVNIKNFGDFECRSER